MRAATRQFVTVVVLLSAMGNAQQQPPAPAVPVNGPAVKLQLPDVPPISGYVAPVANTRTGDSAALPDRSMPAGLRPGLLGFLGPYHRPTVPPLFPGNGARLRSLVREGKLYLSLRDAIALAIEDNLDVEIERYNLVLADTDIRRAAGGGSLRGIDYTVQEPPNGVGGPGSPLLNMAAVNPNPTTPTVTDLTSLNATTQTQTNLSQIATGGAYSTGPAVPLFDPSFILTAGYLQRSNTVQLGSSSTTGSTSTSSSTTTPGTLRFVTANAAYIEGFRTGAQLEATANNDSQVIYGSSGNLNPLSQPSTSVTLTQPLLRGFGSGVNLRYLRIARLDRRESALLFEQQVLEMVYGVSRLYFDLVSLGENVAVKEQALQAATKLHDDDALQVEQGTLAPIELTRVTALQNASRFDLVQAQGLYRTQEVILRNLLVRQSSPVFAVEFERIVPTDRIVVPESPDPTPVAELIQQGLSHRPDLAQAQLQIQTGKVNVQASRNEALPQLNLYANAETRGSAEQSYEQLGSPGTAMPTVPQNLQLGGLRVSTIYQAGIQLTLPLRNRVAQADAARDEVQLRQVQARTEKLANGIRQDVENASIALETSFAAYKAAIASREAQEQLLQAERDKLEFGQSTPLLVIQNEAYVSQARSTEIAARSNWMKARIELDRSLGDLLDKNGITLDEAIRGEVR